MQNMAIAIYAKIRNLDYLTLCTIFSHLTLSETYQNITDSSGHVEGPVGAFDSIKFGQLGGKLEVKRQNMATAIYAKIRNLDYLTLCTIFSHSILSETYQNITDSSGYV